MKGVAFTMDAVFAIMIAAMAISILLYFHYAPINQYAIKFSSLNSLVYVLSTTTLSNFTASSLAVDMVNQYNSASQDWPEYYQNNANNASNIYGPSSDNLAFIYTATNTIYPNSLVAGDGALYFIYTWPWIYAPLGYQSVITDAGPHSAGYPYNPQAAGIGYSNSNTIITSDMVYNNVLVYTNETSLVYPYAWSNANAIPSSGVVSSPITAYDNIILVPIYVSGNAAETGIKGFYANNGTMAWMANTGGEVNSTAIVSGMIAAEVGNTVEMFLYSSQGAPVNLYNTSYPYKPTGIIAYNGMAYVADSATYSGISVYNGSLFYQSTTNYTHATGNVKSGSWTVYMPPYVGSTMSSGQPIASNGNLYTLWSKGYLVDQNTYDGSIRWATHIPYPGTISPHMVLAYGELYVAVGNKLLGFGTCPGYPEKSLLSNMASLALFALSGCADSLLNAANPTENASLTIQNGYSSSGADLLPNNDLMFPYVMNFSGAFLYNTGQNSYVEAGNNSILSPEAGASGKMSLCTWYKVNSLSEYHGTLIKAKNPPSNGNAWEYTLDQGGYVSGVSTHPSFTVWDSSGNNKIASGDANTTTFNAIVNRWSFACFTYDYPDQKAYYYFNGVQYPANITTAYGPATAGTGSLIIGAGDNLSNPSGSPGYSKVAMADLQVYNAILSNNQIKTLYSQGITASPIQSNAIVGWWPLAGDANDYSGNGNVGFPFNVTFAYSGFISPDYQNSYTVGIAKATVVAEDISVYLWYLDNFGITSGGYPENSTFSAGVYNWK